MCRYVSWEFRIPCVLCITRLVLIDTNVIVLLLFLANHCQEWFNVVRIILNDLVAITKRRSVVQYSFFIDTTRATNKQLTKKMNGIIRICPQYIGLAKNLTLEFAFISASWCHHLSGWKGHFSHDFSIFLCYILLISSFERHLRLIRNIDI